MSDNSRPTNSKRVTVPVIVAAVAALVAIAMVFVPKFSGTTSADEVPVKDVRVQPREPLDKNDPLAKLVRRDPEDPMALGEVDAPVVMVNYSEFQCPFCGKFARDTEPTLIKKYVKDGTLRIEWRDFPYLGPESTTAARAGRAAAAQGEFWAFHDAMYANQQPPNSGLLTEKYLAGVADKIGLNVAQFRKDMASPEIAKAVQRDFNEGQAIGVTGTPAFLINGRPVIGAQPTDVFTGTIEKAAAEAR